MNTEILEKEQLFKMIQKKRSEMIQLGNNYGLTHDKTVNCSQELDGLLNEYQDMLEQGNHYQTCVKEKPVFFYWNQQIPAN